MFLDIQILEPYRVRETDFSKLGWPFRYLFFFLIILRLLTKHILQLQNLKLKESM